MDSHGRAHTVLYQLLPDLRAFLILLDGEKLSPFAQAQKRSISELLTKLQDPPAEDTEYMVMNCPAVESSSGVQVHGPPSTDGLLRTAVQLSRCAEEPFSSCVAGWPPKASPIPVNSSAAGSDGGHFEGAEPVPSVTLTSGKASSNGSLYKSYSNEEGEEEDSVKDHAHYLEWMASQSCLRLPSRSHIWGFLWRRRWLGQWNKQLFIIRQHLLLGYRCPQDLHPTLELGLEGCRVSCRSKPSGKFPFQLKVVAASQTLVLGFHSWLQAQEWRKVIEEVSSCYQSDETSLNSLSLFDSDGRDSRRSSSGSLKVSSKDQPSGPPSCQRQKTEGRGFLNVLMHCQWQSLWCQLEGGALRMFRDQNSKTGPQYCLRLQGCQVQASGKGKGAHRITVTQRGDQVAILEAGTEMEGQRWLHLLQEISTWYGAAHTALRSLKTCRSPSPSVYSDGPSHKVFGTAQPHPIYCNISEVQSSKSGATGDPVQLEDLRHYGNVQGTAGVMGGVATDLEDRSQRRSLLVSRRGSELDLLEAKSLSRSATCVGFLCRHGPALELLWNISLLLVH